MARHNGMTYRAMRETTKTIQRATSINELRYTFPAGAVPTWDELMRDESALSCLLQTCTAIVSTHRMYSHLTPWETYAAIVSLMAETHAERLKVAARTEGAE
jgi:hypothetical protein